MLKKWEDLPQKMKCDALRRYYDILQRHKAGLILKRAFDITLSAILLILLSPIFIIIAAAIKLDSKGSIFYRQERVTQYGRTFRIHKFRSMVSGADKKGSLVTIKGDSRITKVGRFIRKCRLDELPQLIDVLKGDMTFVGMRAEVPKYVDEYTEEMLSTLLLPAGITSEACIRYKDETEMLDGAEDVDKAYVEKVLPGKMYYGLKAIENFSFFGDIKTMARTVFAVLGKRYENDGAVVIKNRKGDETI